MVVHSLKSHFKQTGFVWSQIVFAFAGIVVLCVGIPVYIWLQRIALSDKLCSLSLHICPLRKMSCEQHSTSSNVWRNVFGIHRVF